MVYNIKLIDSKILKITLWKLYHSIIVKKYSDAYKVKELKVISRRWYVEANSALFQL